MSLSALRLLVVGCNIVLACLLALPGRSMAQQQVAEPDLKAAIVVNMLLFVDWPRPDALSNSALSICYFSNSAVAEALATLDGKAIRGRQLNVIRANASMLHRCQAAYLAPADDVLLASLRSGELPGRMLLVGDTPGFLDRGGMVNLVLFAGRVSFDVDLAALRRAGLSLSSKALRLARTVRE